MARSSTFNDNQDAYHRSNTFPPWERENIAQVPYLGAASPSLSNAEREALPSLWAVHTSNSAATNARGNLHMRYASDSSQRHRRSSDDYSNNWAARVPLTAPPLARPYDTPTYIPPGPKSTPNPPSFVRPPPTPPESDFGSSTTGSVAGSPAWRHDVKPLPTIPASVEPPQPARARAASSVHESRKSVAKLKRWKCAIKEMFKSHPEDESEVEHISAQRHWTDE